MNTSAFQRLAFRIRPELATITGVERSGQLLNVYSVILYSPLLLIGLVWLASQTNINLFIKHSGVFIGLFVLAFILQRYSFEVQIELRPGVVASSEGNFVFVLSLTSLFVFGLSALWLDLLPQIIFTLYRFAREKNLNVRWGQAASLASSISTGTFPYLTGFWAYQRLGGQLPFASFAFPSLFPAIILLLTSALVPYLIMFPLIRYIAHTPEIVGENQGNLQNLYFFIFTESIVQYLAMPFTLLGAYLYTVNGPGILFFFLMVVLLVSLLANQLTNNVKQRTQRARELAALEELGRKIIAAPPDLSSLPDILTTQFPLMFHAIRGMIWLEPGHTLYRSANTTFPTLEHLQALIQENGNTPYHYLNPGAVDGDPLREGLVVPVRNEQNHLLGGILLASRQDQTRVKDYLPALQALAAQISSALYRAEAHKEALLKARMANELELAGRIQANFLPAEIPTLPGYEIAASLSPALQTSGDFYDFISLPDGRLGILIADVADKGTGAALFMALTRTLIRTYVLEYPDDPALAFKLTNDRVHEDTQSQLFITTFYGIIDPQQHTLTYINGGHNPPLLFRAANESPESLTRTGIPIGMFEDAKWTKKTVLLQPGNLTILYTDGVTEAQNKAEEFFGDERLLELGKSSLGYTAKEVHNTTLTSIRSFVGDAPQFDDITLIVIRRASG